MIEVARAQYRGAGPRNSRAPACTNPSAFSPARRIARVDLLGKKSVLNLCANNYLGLSDHPEVVAAAHEALDRWGYGLSSVRFICGTQEIHKQLESRLSEFLGMEDTILYSSCFDANGGLFETLMDAEDAIVSDELNHASIIDGIRLSKAQRFRYRNGDMGDLEKNLKEASHARRILIATDGVFSMDGFIAKLPEICDLAEKYKAMVMVDDSHAVGFMGENGRGTHEHHHVMGRVDILTGTLGKALGRRQWRLRQRAQGNRGLAAPALASISFLEHRRAGHRGRIFESARSGDANERSPGAPLFEYSVFPQENVRDGLQHSAGRTSYRSRNVGRRRCSCENGRALTGEGSLRSRLFLPRGA